MLSGLDALIDVLDPPACVLPDGARDRRFAGTHEADKIQLVGFHARSDSRTEKNSGYDTAAAQASWMTVGPEAPRAAMANAMARR